MLTNNFQKILNYMFNNRPLVVVDNIVGIDGRIIKSSNANSIPLDYLNKSKQAISTSTSDTIKAEGGVFIAYGKGTGTATPYDYCLGSEIPDWNLTLLGNSLSITDNGYIVISSIKNHTNEDIIVKELGIFETSISDSGIESTYMLTRNVLETPITIKPKETKTFTVTINF